MSLQYDRQIKISSAGSRKATLWPAQALYWSELIEKLKTPTRGVESLLEYLRLPKSRQDELKDVGGFVGGTLKDNRRKVTNVLGRDIVTLDLDNIQSGETNTILLRLESLGCGYAVYSTRKHEPIKPRLRILVPLDRTATSDEYKPLARKLASWIGIDMCDPSTFETHRLMYWPSCCSDSQYVYQVGDKPFLSVDGVLAQYADWRNVAEWPQVPGVQAEHVKLAQRQGDPLTKSGVVGAFCRVYDVYSAIETFLPGIYTVCDNLEDRLTFTGGSTVGGAIIYENGNFLYSHHATDPAGSKLCNAFDLVRLHKFGHMDDDVKPDTPANKYPSYTAMCEFAVSDGQVSTLLNQERYEKAMSEFKGVSVIENSNWISKLKVNSKGSILKTVDNILTILENDPMLKGKIAYDSFLEKAIVGNDLPWASSDSEDYWRPWDDADESGLIGYLQKDMYRIPNCSDIKHALNLMWRKNTFNELKDYISSLEWDGIPRLDTLFIDYYGAEDTLYTRTVTRKTLVAAIARLMNPGCKFDYMLILEGPQGIGKSKLLSELAIKRKYYLDELRTFEGKEASELIRGKWIVEVAELSAFNRSESNAIKGFLTRSTDTYRPAYGHNSKDYPRKCVFIGTTNSDEYLKDATGERRYWPIKLNLNKAVKNKNEIPNLVVQIWAEAYSRWQLGENLYLSDELEAVADTVRQGRKVRDDRQGLIEEFLKRPIPVDWEKKHLNKENSIGAVNSKNTILKLRNEKRLVLQKY
ncbi:virulence-associated E family protein [Pseudobacteroides cellulosolvens]|uniref:Virulence-associated E family protein n=1 Tax=Pseudobacteroides cellulosolvens ATCC 35603 = DSM 2933 TaxID=398512 RepID=A0A0L6JVF6_9FIRM|nr:virulence-associated E family protein [Pseudobacteroides cellulosolvens]KNY29841.1 virulence-associated E family protein [Pseudobacteroides cellulosolvens ATCC 35603 = DSM 2933]